ncbi:replication fork protection component Swi3-domain-containing protein [Spinellus fusiger]|nr:replication fork protection component Swi3-domain-containing protein [Spinellus fusiger]
MDLNESFGELLDGLDPFQDEQTTENKVYDPLAPVNKRKSRTEDEQRSVRPRRVFKKLDTELLLSEKGLSRLRHEAPWLRFKGRGYEDMDLARIIEFYQMWAHDLYPRLPLRDFSQKVLKATANERCKTMLAAWQDEYENAHRMPAEELSELRVQDEEEETDEEETETSSRSSALDPPHSALDAIKHTIQQPISLSTPPKVDQAKVNRAAALAKLAARKKEQTQQRLYAESQQAQEEQHTHEGYDDYEEDPGAEYLDDM